MSEKDPKVVGGTSQACLPKWCAQEMKGRVCLSPKGLAAFGWSWKTSVPRNSSGVCVPLRRPRWGSAPHQTSLGRPVSPLQSLSGKGWPPSSDGLCPGPLFPCTGCQPGPGQPRAAVFCPHPPSQGKRLQAIPLPAWAHTSALGATFLDSSGPQTGAQPHLASILPQGGARPPPQLCAPACPPKHRETPTVLLAERKPTPGRALRRRCSTHSISSPHNTPSPAPVTVT